MAKGILHQSNYAVQIEVDSFHMVSDLPISSGGLNAGPTPSNLLLSALVACITITLKTYTERKGWNLGAIEVSCSFIVSGSAPYYSDNKLRRLK